MKLVLYFPTLLGIFFLGLSDSAPLPNANQDISQYKTELKAWLKKKDELEKIHGAAKSSDDDFEKTVPKPGEMFEGDIIMDEDLRNAVLGRTDKRSAIRDLRKRWPNNVLPYEFAKDVPTRVRRHIRRVLRNFRKYTCIHVVPRTDQKAYVIVRYHPNMCASYVGMQSPDRAQYITLGRGCQRDGTIEHEFMHALGIIHEQSRSDRDDYVSIKWNHIAQKEFHNFQKYTLEETTNDGKKYDFSSVMHYGPWAFSDDGQKTILPKGDIDVDYGQRRGFSEGDVQELNKLYNCPTRQQDTSGLIPSTDGKRDMVGFGEDRFNPLHFK